MSGAYGMMLKGAFTSENASAAGLGLNIVGTFLADRTLKLSGKLEQNQIDLQMEQNTLASTQQALANQDRLNYTLSLQRVIAASRGQQAGQGSALAAEQFSLREHGQEEHNRQSTLLSANAQAKQLKAAVGVQTNSKRAQVWSGFMNSNLNSTSLNQLMGDYLNPAQGSKL